MIRSTLDGSTAGAKDARKCDLSELAMRASSLLSQVVAFPPRPHSKSIAGGIVSISKTSLMQQTNSQSSMTPTMMPAASYLGQRHQHGFSFSCGKVAETQDADKRSFTGNSRSDMTFPETLMHMLSDQSSADVITWLPHGQAFVILRPGFLTDYVLPNYFDSDDKRRKGAMKYTSFTRKLNRW